ncbi:mCG1032910 [Mus musculus]|nr:mCG1032910 [Mus musculus]
MTYTGGEGPRKISKNAGQKRGGVPKATTSRFLMLILLSPQGAPGKGVPSTTSQK